MIDETQGGRWDRILNWHEAVGLPLTPDGVAELEDVATEMLRHTAEMACATALKFLPQIHIPGQPMMSIYLGYYDGFKRFKIGVSNDPEARAKSINRSLISLGFSPDFCILDSRLLGRKEAFKLETSMHLQLAKFRCGQEWFEDKAGDLLDAVWIQATEAATEDHRSKLLAPVFNLPSGLFQVQTRLSAICVLHAKWLKYAEQVLDNLEGFHARSSRVS